MTATFTTLATCALALSFALIMQTRAAETTHQHQLVGASAFSDPDVKAYAAMMDAAMTKMHADMTAAKPSGNPDRDFATMMIPHHQGAVDMAEIQLRFGHDERLRRLAQGIIVEQRQEIAVMQAILNEPSQTNPGSPIQPLSAVADHDHKDSQK